MDDASERAAPRGLVTASLRSAAPAALGALARRLGNFDDAEDALQEAMLAAASAWQRDGIPENPTGWLITAGGRRAIDAARSEAARREREIRATASEPSDRPVIDTDDTLAVYLMCCHPSLSRALQVPLTLRSVGGLTTREIARGLVASEASIAQRLTRARATLRASGATFAMPTDPEMPDRIGAVLDVLGIIHTESHSPADGDAVTRPLLGAEALRLARELLSRTRRAAPWRGEVMGLVALMLLTDARSPARLADDGSLIALADQDRSLWRTDVIGQADQLLQQALVGYPLGPFQLKAAIAAVHDTAPSFDATDWRQLLSLYDLLRVVSPGPVVELARLVPLAEVTSPGEALAELDRLESTSPARHSSAIRAHLLARAGRDPAQAYREAATHAPNSVQRRWLERQADVATGDRNGRAIASVVDHMEDTYLRGLLESARTIAIVGLSTDTQKTSSKIATVLIDAGYDVIPVHPKATEILGRTAYPSLADIPVPVDIVDVFRPADEAPAVAQAAAAIGVKTLWLQLGISSSEAKAIAEAAELQYVEDTCIGATTKRLGVHAAAL